MLGHIRVDNDSVRRRVAEALQLVGLKLTEHPPAAGRTRDVSVDRSHYIGDHSTALRTWLGLRHGSIFASCRTLWEAGDAFVAICESGNALPVELCIRQRASSAATSRVAASVRTQLAASDDFLRTRQSRLSA
jgi:hypothetical protein